MISLPSFLCLQWDQTSQCHCQIGSWISDVIIVKYFLWDLYLADISQDRVNDNFYNWSTMNRLPVCPNYQLVVRRLDLFENFKTKIEKMSQKSIFLRWFAPSALGNAADDPQKTIKWPQRSIRCLSFHVMWSIYMASGALFHVMCLSVANVIQQ